MSYEKHVYPARLPENLLAVWKDELLRHGLDVAFHPSFRLRTWSGGYLPCRVLVHAGAFQTSHLYGPQAFRAGFEFSALFEGAEKAHVLSEYAAEMKEEGTPLPRGLLRRLRAAPAMFALAHGGFRWPPEDFRLCWFAAAALATATGGLLFDEWHEGKGLGYIDPDEALIIADTRSMQYEQAPERPPDSFPPPPFSGFD